jgi:hypothetical protein
MALTVRPWTADDAAAWAHARRPRGGPHPGQPAAGQGPRHAAPGAGVADRSRPGGGPGALPPAHARGAADAGRLARAARGHGIVQPDGCPLVESVAGAGPQRPTLCDLSRHLRRRPGVGLLPKVA